MEEIFDRQDVPEDAKEALRKSFAEQERKLREIEQHLDKLRKALGGMINVIALTVESKDPNSAGHQRRSADLARTIATAMGLSEGQIDGIRMAGVVHDLGKLIIPSEILIKPDPLSEVEKDLIRTHPKVGFHMLKEVEFPWPVADIVLQHHERINGAGYPSGLTGESISIEARILGVADVVEAITSQRAYRPSRDMDYALQELSRNSGILYDPRVVDTCLMCISTRGYKFR